MEADDVSITVSTPEMMKSNEHNDSGDDKVANTRPTCETETS